MDIPLAYFLARHTGRPVKMVMDYVEESLQASTNTIPGGFMRAPGEI